MKAKNKKIFGIGVNDADYSVYKYELIEGVWKSVWICPFYVKWKDMFKRCYDAKYHAKINYTDCYVTPEWHYFMQFKSWMKTQDWEGKELDKDLLFPGNKIYSPETCVFIDRKINKFLTERRSSRGDLPIGVSLDKRTGRFAAKCSDFVSGKRKHLGIHDTPEEAYRAWLAFKLSQAYVLAREQTDLRVTAALIYRYQHYIELFA